MKTAPRTNWKLVLGANKYTAANQNPYAWYKNLGLWFYFKKDIYLLIQKHNILAESCTTVLVADDPHAKSTVTNDSICVKTRKKTKQMKRLDQDFWMGKGLHTIADWWDQKYFGKSAGKNSALPWWQTGETVLSSLVWTFNIFCTSAFLFVDTLCPEGHSRCVLLATPAWWKAMELILEI